MARLCALAAKSGKALGAHPGYPDRANFGRLELQLSPVEIETTVAAQLHSLAAHARCAGTRLTHVKPHGALYHAAMRRRDVAEAIARAAAPFTPIRLIGLAGAPALTWWQSMGYPTAAEAFADRRYLADGSLVPRTDPLALIEHPDMAAAQALRIARREGVLADDGALVPIAADTICIHSDTPGALDSARTIVRRCRDNGITIAPPR